MSLTRLLHEGFVRSAFSETAEPLYLTSGYVYDSAEQSEDVFEGRLERHQYTRYTNPTLDVTEHRLCVLEQAERCLTTASGMAAVFGTLAGLLSAGDRLVAARAMFGSCLKVATEILPKFGIRTELVDGTDIEAWRAALSVPTQAVLVEIPANPMLQIADLPAIAALTRAAGAVCVVDAALAAPGTLQPLRHGADVAVYSLTKHADGQGRVMGGAVLGNKELLETRIMPFLRHTGPALSPYNAWVIGQSLVTLPLRMRAQSENALAAAQMFEADARVARVSYPGLPSHPQHALAQRLLPHGGTMVAVTLHGGKAAAYRFMNALRLCKISNNLGDARSLITHPATSTHRSVPEGERLQLGIEAGTVRISIGLEEVDDLCADFRQALDALAG